MLIFFICIVYLFKFWWAVHTLHTQSDEDARVRGFGGLGKKQKIFFVVRLRTLNFFVVILIVVYLNVVSVVFI